MATSPDYSCDICNGRNLKTTAEHWCSECEECFCTKSLEHHSISKLSKEHEVISITDYKKLPGSVSKLTQHCEEHQRQYHLYCHNHDSLCCAACVITTHKGCSGLVAIDDVIKNARTSTLLDTLAQTLVKIEQNCKKVSEDRKQNVKDILEQKQKFRDEIKLSRIRINSHLDELEKNIIDEMNTEEENVKIQIEDLLETLAEKRGEVEDLRKSVFAVKSYASNLQAFLGSTILEEEVEKIEKFMQSLSEDSRMRQIHFEYGISRDITNICSTESYGSITATEGPSSSTLSTADNKENIQVTQ